MYFTDFTYVIDLFFFFVYWVFITLMFCIVVMFVITDLHIHICNYCSNVYNLSFLQNSVVLPPVTQ